MHYSPYHKKQKLTATSAIHMAPGPSSFTALLVVGMTPVAAPPRYQLPMSVSLPLPSSMDALGPTELTDERKEPK
jgi:hypothetical protein